MNIAVVDDEEIIRQQILCHMKKINNVEMVKGNQAGRYYYCLSGSLVTYQCGRRILDILVMPPGEVKKYCVFGFAKA